MSYKWDEPVSKPEAYQALMVLDDFIESRGLSLDDPVIAAWLLLEEFVRNET